MSEDGFRTLQQKLLLLYMVFSCVLLLAVLTTVGVLLYQNLMHTARTTVHYDLDGYMNQLEQEGWIDHMDLGMDELKNDYAIFILEDEKDTLYTGSYLNPEERALLREEISKAELSYSTGVGSCTLHMFSTSFYVCQKVSRNGRIQCFVCKNLKRVKNSFSFQLIILSTAFLAGCMLLYFLSKKMSISAMKPVRENMEKQIAFIHAASHELKSPLAVIRANNSACAADASNSDRYRGIIEDECRRMASLIQELLLIATDTTLGLRIEKKPQRADTILIQCYEKMLPFVRNAGMPLSIEIGEDDFGEILVDEARMSQVLEALVSNAAAYGRSEKGILLALKKEKRQVCFIVRDYGPGIAKEDYHKVFDRFYRGAADRNDKSHFGLGLSIAQQLTHAMGGKIQLRDTEGAGACFVVLFREL